MQVSEAPTIQLHAQRIWHEVASGCMRSTVGEEVFAHVRQSMLTQARQLAALS